LLVGKQDVDRNQSGEVRLLRPHKHQGQVQHDGEPLRVNYSTGTICRATADGPVTYLLHHRRKAVFLKLIRVS
jgi:hypothetical protein